MTSFVEAVKHEVWAHGNGGDSWAIEWYRDGGAWPLNRSITFMESHAAIEGVEWREYVRVSYDMEHGRTPLANFRKYGEVPV